MLLNNRYEFQTDNMLGQGGFGKTYLAIDLNSPSRRKCVVKQLNSKLAKNRFEREAAILEKLSEGSLQIPRLYAYVIKDGEFYLVQEFVEGPTLTQKIKKEGRLSEPVVRKIVISLLDVLDFIHNFRGEIAGEQIIGIIHRDIKPENIILRAKDDFPVLLDFGVVKEVDQLDSDGNPTSSVEIGTRGFMPLEQVNGKPMPPSDLYALGVTAIVLLTGKNPNLMRDSQTGDLNWEQHARVSQEFADVLNRATKLRPQDRYSSAKEMQRVLNQLEKKRKFSLTAALRSLFPDLSKYPSLLRSVQFALGHELLKFSKYLESSIEEELNLTENQITEKYDPEFWCSFIFPITTFFIGYIWKLYWIGFPKNQEGFLLLWTALTNLLLMIYLFVSWLRPKKKHVYKIMSYFLRFEWFITLSFFSPVWFIAGYEIGKPFDVFASFMMSLILFCFPVLFLLSSTFIPGLNSIIVSVIEIVVEKTGHLFLKGKTNNN